MPTDQPTTTTASTSASPSLETTPGDPPPLPAPAVTVVGRTVRAFTPAALRSLERVERPYTVACASGERARARWTGAPVSTLLDAVEAPPDTTHLRLSSRDGYRVCVPVRDALDGVVADARDGERLALTRPYATRFLASDVDGARLVKGLARVETLALAPDEDPDEFAAVGANPEFG
jgi:DMSO/TMAO reductase YedYZ molybdopterin-dependent catalytic subunit